MRLKRVTIKEFRRFTDLTVQRIPATARLVMLAGPNGYGKSSFFDALYTWHNWQSNKNRTWDPDYHGKAGSSRRQRLTNDVDVELHDPVPAEMKKILYVRSAYRNDPEFRVGSLQHQGDPLARVPFQRMIDNDAAVSRNYQDLASQGLEDLYELEEGQTTFADYRVRSIGDIRDQLRRLFPDLELHSLANPLRDGTFRFTKGTSRGFVFKNLSGGEKAAFDLILDLVVARRDYDDTIYCIDEPEAHMHAHLQGELLSVLLDLIPENCQLILATHSIGMMRRAQEIERESPGSVVFLDFGNGHFDEPQTIEPAETSRSFWKKMYSVALGDVAELVAPERVVICEGEPVTTPPVRNHSLDAQCYERIFAEEFPETEFISMGSDQQIRGDKRGLAEALRKLISAMSVVRLIDHDDRSPEEVEEAKREGVRVLSRRNLESYLFNDEVLQALAAEEGLEGSAEELLKQKQAILASKLGRAADDLKPARGEIYEACKRVLSLTQRGNDVNAFMRDTLAPLVRPGTGVYYELRRDIFDM